MQESGDLFSQWEGTDHGEEENFSSLLEESDSGVSEEEHSAILAQIEELLGGSEGLEHGEEFRYNPLHRGAIFPILINIGVILCTILALVLIYTSHNRQQRSLISSDRTISTTEGSLLREYREETEEELSEREREISSIRTELNSLESEKRQLEAETKMIIQEKTAELEGELERQLEAERARLSSAGTDAEATQQRLSELREEIAASHREELEELQAESEAAIEAKDAEIQAEIAGYEDQLRSYGAEQEIAQRQIGQLQEQRQEAELFSQQISSAYIATIDSLESRNFEEARSSLAILRELTSRESLSRHSVLAQRLEADRALQSALSSLISLQEEALQEQAAGSEAESKSRQALASAETKISELQNTIESQRERINIQEQRLATLENNLQERSTELSRTASQVARLQNQLAAARRQIGELQDLKSEFEERSRRVEQLETFIPLASASQPEKARKDEILEALETRVEILEALNSNTVQSLYPEIETVFERYLDSFEQEYLHQGYQEALRDTIKLLEQVGDASSPADSTSAPGEEFPIWR